MSFFVTILPIIILGLSSAPEAPERPELVSPETAAQQIKGCGAGAVDIRYEDFLQSYVLTVRDASEAELQCIERAASYHDVELPPALQKGFDEIRAAKYSAAYREEVTAWLSKRGLLDKVSKLREAETDDAAFSEELEAICGPAAKGALKSEYGQRTLSPEWLRKIPLPARAEDDEAIACLVASASVGGFDIGFIGNEAPSE